MNKSSEKNCEWRNNFIHGNPRKIKWKIKKFKIEKEKCKKKTKQIKQFWLRKQIKKKNDEKIHRLQVNFLLERNFLFVQFFLFFLIKWLKDIYDFNVNKLNKKKGNALQLKTQSNLL